MSSKPLVLVTGVSGFVGSHVAVQLIQAGYTVRGTARAAKAEVLRTTLASKYPSLEISVVDDITGDDIKNVLSGVGAVIHVASPLVGKEAPDQSLKSAMDGTLNVLRNATEAGITKFVITSSWGATIDPDLKQVWQGLTLDEKSWGQVAPEDVLSGKLNPFEVYIACKILAERAVWDFAASNPKVDISTINPPFIYGPFAEGFPTPSPTNLGSNGLIYQLISGEAGRPLPPHSSPFAVDIRDVTRAHLAALELPRDAAPEPKRFIVSSGAFLWIEGAEHILKTRPELKHRLPSIENPPPTPGPLSTIDTSFAKKYLHINEYISWQDTFTATLDGLLEAEKTWRI